MTKDGRGIPTSNRYDSPARRLLIPEFRLLTVNFLDSPNAPDPLEHEFVEEVYGYFPNFPVIIQGDGAPWDIGNLYLVNRLKKSVSYESRTYQSVASHLLDYLRFLEDEGLSFLAFPENDSLKVTYRYRQRLIDQINAGEVGARTGKLRMNAVVGFYKHIMKYGLVNSSAFMYQPFDVVLKYFSIVSNFGLSRRLVVESHNLAITVPAPQKQLEYINDGGMLRPLSIDEQEKVLVGLQESSREYQLIFYIALFTGARIQTVCTIQVRHIWRDLDGQGNLRLPIGGGSGVDTKWGSMMTLIIPAWLVHDLRIYSRSLEAKRRRAQSFYGDVESNYLFLTSNGSEHYTSKREIKDRGVAEVNQIASNRDRAYGSIREGATIRQFIQETLLPRIRQGDKLFQRFRFHDLRASFGMNLLEREIEIRGSKGVMAALEEVQQRMGHKDKSTTLQYLNYRSSLERKADIQSKFEARLFKHVNTSARLDVVSHD